MRSPTRLRKRAEEAPRPSAVRRCPSCGATASAAAIQCTVCGHAFVSSGDVAGLWGSVPAAPAAEAAPLLDLYAEGDGSIFRAGAAAAPAAPARPRIDLAADMRPAPAPAADPWASSSGTLSVQPGIPGSGSFAPPTSPAALESLERGEGRRRRGDGLRRALLLLVLVLVAAGAAAWFGGRPYLTARIADDVGAAIDHELEGVAALPVDEDGTVTVVERDVSRALRANAAAYEPVTSPRVSFSRNGVRVDFDLYGQAHTLTGTLAVEAGRLVVVDPVLDGSAAALVDVDEIVASAEESVSDMFARLGVRPVSVRTSDDTLRVGTEAVG